jgi:chromosomal replication initiator protein
MEDRLKSRLQWGLITDIKPPGFETRVAILKQKAALENVEVPDGVAMFMARHVTRNVRELEGALRRLLALSAMFGRAPDQEMAEQTLGVLSAHLHRVDPQQIIKAVGADYGVSPADMKGPRRHRNITVPRQLAMYLVRELTDESLPQIGAHFGGRDHSTVINALKRVEALRDADPDMRARIERVRRALQP